MRPKSRQQIGTPPRVARPRLFLGLNAEFACQNPVHVKILCKTLSHPYHFKRLHFSSVNLTPSRDEFVRLASQGNLIPVSTEIIADAETPVSAFAKLSGTSPCYLLESAEITDVVGRFSFLGISPFFMFEARGDEVVVKDHLGSRIMRYDGDPLELLKTCLSAYRLVRPRGELAHNPATAGAVGYISYDCIRHFEPATGLQPNDDLGTDEMIFMACEVVLVFDHRSRRLRLASNTLIRPAETPEAAYDRATERIAATIASLSAPAALPPLSAYVERSPAPPPQSNTSREEFIKMVLKAKEHIRAGDIFQVVLSQRFEAPFAGAPLDLYRALRFINPSPYLFCLHLPENRALVGSSPEVHVRLQDGAVEIRPIAGTRRRGATSEEDAENAAGLLGDPKERAEHLMLVDLARNDLGRIAEYGTVRVRDFMSIEKYSHVMHIVSDVVGTLSGGRNAFDVLRATFPAGTVSGAPKVRAMQIINKLEKSKRGPYAGAIAFFGFDGNLDSCITLRSVLLQGNTAYVQAGAGVVADSTPEGEYEETINKASGMMRAIALAAADVSPRPVTDQHLKR